jgi:hypothetical protein
MKTYIFVIFFAVQLLITSCSEDDITETNRECLIDIDTIDFTFGIDYDNSEKYLIPGEESDLNNSYLEEIRDEIGTPGNRIDDILLVCQWINQNFTFEDAGGTMAGINTVDELYEIKTIYGCHSLSLLISSVLREFGFPAVMIETASIQWGYDYNAGKIQYLKGHVMSEIFVENKWILFDNNGTYIKEYNPLNPFISAVNSSQDDYFVFAKGIDIWDYSGRDELFTYNKMLYFSENIYCFEEMFNSVNYYWDN